MFNDMNIFVPSVNNYGPYTNLKASFEYCSATTSEMKLSIILT